MGTPGLAHCTDMESEDHELHGAQRERAGDWPGARSKQRSVRAEQEICSVLNVEHPGQEEPCIRSGGWRGTNGRGRLSTEFLFIGQPHLSRLREHCFSNHCRLTFKRRPGASRGTREPPHPTWTFAPGPSSAAGGPLFRSCWGGEWVLLDGS